MDKESCVVLKDNVERLEKPYDVKYKGCLLGQRVACKENALVA
jgi:hypothetical protein